MESSNRVIGTTNRSDPVNGMELLYPNGFNRNENRRGKPLVQVQDTAGDDDDEFEYDNFDFTSDGSPSENVTVTIKFSSQTDSVIAETRDPKTGDTIASHTVASRRVANGTTRRKSPPTLENGSLNKGIINQESVTPETPVETTLPTGSLILGACKGIKELDDKGIIKETDTESNLNVDNIPVDITTVDDNESLGACAILAQDIIVDSESGVSDLSIVDSCERKNDQSVRTIENNQLNTSVTNESEPFIENDQQEEVLDLKQDDSHATEFDGVNDGYNKSPSSCIIDSQDVALEVMGPLSSQAVINLQVESATYVYEDKEDSSAINSQIQTVCEEIDNAIPDQSVETCSSTRTQDSLYDEYEKMLEQSISTDANKAETEQNNRKPLSVQDTSDCESMTAMQHDKCRAKDYQRDGTNRKMVVKTPANVRPDCRLEMVSPITKTPIFVERSPSEEDDGEDFMKYLKELRSDSPVVIEIGEDEEDQYERTADKSDPRPHSSSPEEPCTDGVLSIVEIDECIAGNEGLDNTSTLRCVIEISDDEINPNEEVIYISDEEANKVDLLNFNFASLQSGTSNTKQTESRNNEKETTCTNEIIELLSDTSSDSDDDDEDKDEDNKNDSHELKQNQNDKEDDSDTDMGNGPTSNTSGSNEGDNGHANDRNNDNGQPDGDNGEDNTGLGNDKFSPGMRCRPSDLDGFSAMKREQGTGNLPGCLVPESDRELFSPEDIEVYQILDVCEKQSDVPHQFQTIDSYCFETSSDISNSTSDQISIASYASNISKSEMKADQRSRNSNSIASLASTSSFDIFADSASNHSESSAGHCELNISIYDNVSDNVDVEDCSSDIRSVCAKIQNLYQCQSDDDEEMLTIPPDDIDIVSLFSDSGSDSSEAFETEIVEDFESAIEEQFWTKTADCSVASSDSDTSPTDDETFENGLDDNMYSDKLCNENEKDSESEYESAGEDDEYDDHESTTSEVKDTFDFIKEIEARLPDSTVKPSCLIGNTANCDEIEMDTAKAHECKQNERNTSSNTSLHKSDSCECEQTENRCNGSSVMGTEVTNNTHNDESDGKEGNYEKEELKRNIDFQSETIQDAIEYKETEEAVDEPKIGINAKDIETRTQREIITESLNSQPRTITYQMPYIKRTDTPKLDHKLVKKLKLICKLRQCKLKKVLPKHDNTCIDDIDTDVDEDASDISESIKHFKDEVDVEMESKCKQTQDSDADEKQGDVALRSGDTVQLGQGYYILGAGDILNLPVGPRQRQRPPDIKDNNMPRSSIYFRGIPGIINNAYKMSNSFPKLGPPNETASHKILHACNRLVTPQSPSKTKAKPEVKHGMMKHTLSHDDPDESEDTDSSTSSEMYEVLLSAKDLLNSSRFEEAETTFLKLYNEIQEKPEHNGRLLVETLTGLADICIRQSRMCRSNPLEWQWLCMHAIALLQYIVEYCESELENQLDNELIDWYQEHRQASELKCRPLEDAFNRALYNCLKHDSSQFDPFQSFSLPNTPVNPNRKSNLFPLSSTMPQYLVMPGMSYRVTDKGLTRHSADDSNVAVDWLAKFQHYCKDRLVNKDSKGVTEKILKSNSSKTDEDTESIMSGGSDGSLDWDHTDLQGIDEISTEVTDQETSPENDYTFEYEIVTSDTEKEGWDFFINQRRNCNFESVVQMAVDGEKGEERPPRESKTMTKEARDIYELEKNEKAKQKFIEAREIISPLHEHSISLTLARLFCRLADKLVQEEEYRKAEAVYEKILDIVDRIQDGTAGMLRFSARIMKNLGTVKSKQGKSSSGLVLLNKALHTYRDLQDDEANFEIAIALIELGNGYIVGKNHEDCVFSYVIIAICDFFEKDSGDTQTASTSSAGSASQLSQMTSSFGSTNNEDSNIEEAVTCYTEAIALLDRYEADEKQVDMFAKAVMRLGDCYFMQNEYDKALECYEKSLTMFRANNMFGKDSLMENAHVLCMLGVSSFMLHVYPRAASVFEMALHMVRCAYGYKRTFLNGMLQSLAGITYYKMKNHHKCVSMCYQAHETYCDIFGDEMPRLDKQKFWLVCQTLYVMGNSYNILNLQAKAMKYLTIARSLMKSSKSRERRQFMRVLQILGDAYFAQYDYKTALTYYNEALEYGECESQISFDEVFDPNCASDEMTIHNHLVSKSAEAHLSMQQYQNAVHYLEQAHDMQEVMGEDIKEDLINTLNQLGYMHSVSGDVNKAIEAYKECLEVFREIHDGQLGADMCTTLGNLGAMCYVKACIAEDPREDRAMTAAAEDYFLNAMALELNTEVCVKYGNFLYSQCKYGDAIIHLNNAVSNDTMATDIVYGGLEKVTLPELLQDEVDTQEEICLPSSCLAHYLLILCHKALHQTRAADDNLICLMEEVNDYDVPLLHSVLGYAMMELMLFAEAAMCFLNATENEEDYQLASENYCICLLILAQRTLMSAIENIWLYYRRMGRAIRF